jgi:hypothetical protein
VALTTAATAMHDTHISINTLTLAYALDICASLKSALLKFASDAITPDRSPAAALLPLRAQIIMALERCLHE